MALRRFPLYDEEFDYGVKGVKGSSSVTAKGNFGTIVYRHRSPFEQYGQKMYHPVDTEEDARYWISYYRTTQITFEGLTYCMYSDVYLVRSIQDED